MSKLEYVLFLSLKLVSREKRHPANPPMFQALLHGAQNIKDHKTPGKSLMGALCLGI